MKAERRHELRESDLEHWLHSAKSFLNEQGRYVVLAIVAVAAVVVGTSMAVGSRTASQERAWQKRRALDFTSVETARESLPTLMVLSTESTDQTFAMSGLLEVGMQALKFAQTVDSPPDHELNELARQAFNTVLDRFVDVPFAIGAAHAGLATVAENDFIGMGDGSQKQKAKKHLQAILDDAALATLPYHSIAEERMASLDATFTRVKLAPSPVDETPPAAVTPPTAPGSKFMKMRVGPDGKLSPDEDGTPSP